MYSMTRTGGQTGKMWYPNGSNEKKAKSVSSNQVFSVITELVLWVGHTQMCWTMWSAADIAQIVSSLGGK